MDAEKEKVLGIWDCLADILRDYDTRTEGDGYSLLKREICGQKVRDLLSEEDCEKAFAASLAINQLLKCANSKMWFDWLYKIHGNKPEERLEEALKTARDMIEKGDFTRAMSGSDRHLSPIFRSALKNSGVALGDENLLSVSGNRTSSTPPSSSAPAP
ncbi:MAG: hypothetical protein IAE63_00440 [Alphaproteobacteria bacterium]|jgi:hypothetical protein|nr:hypothetical protein [Alphaproteobacteria bacterium]